MSKKSQKTKNTVSVCAHAMPHAVCCGGPNIAAHAFAGVSNFLHGVTGITAQLIFMPPLATWASNQMTPHVLKGINKVNYKFIKKDHDEYTQKNAVIKKKPNNPLKKSWWKENKKSLIYGLAIQSAFTFASHNFLHNHDDQDGHEGHNHANHVHYQDNAHDLTEKGIETDKVYYLEVSGNQPLELTP